MTRTFKPQIRRHVLGGWSWRVTDDDGEVWDQGDTMTRWGARHEAKLSAKVKAARQEEALNPRWEDIK